MIKTLDAPAELADASLVGHKFARQQRLRDTGVSVPPFFCVVVESPWTTIADVVGTFPGVGAGAERLTAWAESARSAAVQVPLTPEMRTAILEKYVDLGSPDVAVRACVVGRDGHPGEDDAADPFAGLTDSYLYVGPGALIDAVSACAASVFSVRSVLYRAQRGIDPSVLSVCVESVHSTVALAEQINGIPGLAQRVLTGDARETLDDIASGVYGSELAADAMTHLRRFGDRALNDLKIEEPTPRQRPEMLIDSLRPFVAAGTSLQEMAIQESTAAREALDELRRICPARSRRAILRVVLCAGRFLFRAREDTRFCRTQLYGFSRDVMSPLGSDLAAAGRLDSPDDYVHLEAEELLGAFDGTSTHVDLRRLARARKKAYLRSCSRPELAASFTTAALPIDDADLRRSAAKSAPAEGSSTVLVGLASSAGTVRGRARLVLRPDVEPGDCAGRILVARETDPGWLSLMMNASGIVVERGSMVSHTAITGRMLGIPTVVAVSGATAAISDGDDIEIDGRSGTVRIFCKHPQKPR